MIGIPNKPAELLGGSVAIQNVPDGLPLSSTAIPKVEGSQQAPATTVKEPKSKSKKSKSKKDKEGKKSKSKKKRAAALLLRRLKFALPRWTAAESRRGAF